MELITGKNKEQFEEWYLKEFHKSDKSDNWASYWLLRFYESMIEMQIGVYLAYYDSLGLIVDVESDFYNDTNTFKWIWHINSNTEWISSIHLEVPPFETRNEAYKEAFKKADQIINAKN